MDNIYNPSNIEKEIQQLWESNNSFSVSEDLTKEKFYCLSMFPYPSGTLHIGHIRNYTLSDVIARYQRMQGKNVLNPIGWDSFGLPAENAAIKNEVDPNSWTQKNIADMRAQFKQMGYSYDWKRELATCDPSYYKWEQWLFTKLYEKGLVYKKNSTVNWDPVDETVLANEQVVDGRGWRSGAIVEQREISQWFIKITAYADELLESLDKLPNWPTQVKTMQRNWIGKSTGCNVNFNLIDRQESITVYTTRVDTIYGVTHLFISPDHPFTKELAVSNKEINKFVEQFKNVKVAEADLETMEKQGIDTGIFAINPINNEKIPVWIANYILAEYGTGAVMSVPAHCHRDWDMAKKYNFPIIQVLEFADSFNPNENASEEHGILINSGEFDGMSSEEALIEVSKKLKEKGLGQKTTQYRLRDWGVSRQRYWGTPIPIIYCDSCGPVSVPESELPVVLPTEVSFKGAQSPLKDIPEFYETTCPKCQSAAKRETDTFDTFVNSSWYYARFASYNQTDAMLDDRAKYWTPVDYYIGGIEHAVLHLLYARFFHKVLRDEGLVNSDEPFNKLMTLGMVHNQGQKMSKSKGNSISPKDLIEKYGADTLRLYIIFAAPPELSLEWVESGIDGAHKFLKKLWSFSENNEALEIYHEANIHTIKTHVYWESATTEQKSIRRELYEVFKQIDYDYHRSQLNTVVSGCMKLMNIISKYEANKQDLLDKFVIYEGYCLLIRALAPITPHICQALWQKLGNQDLIMDASWPSIPKDALRTEELEFIVQINGKLRGKLMMAANNSKDEIEQKVLQEEFVNKYSEGKSLKKIIILPERKLINLVYVDK